MVACREGGFMNPPMHSQVTPECSGETDARSGVQSRSEGKTVTRYHRQRETASKDSTMANTDTNRVNQIYREWKFP